MSHVSFQAIELPARLANDWEDTSINVGRADLFASAYWRECGLARDTHGRHEDYKCHGEQAAGGGFLWQAKGNVGEPSSSLA
jgi:hypothetical protein